MHHFLIYKLGQRKREKEKEEEASCWEGEKWLLSEPTSLGLDQSIRKAKFQFT